MEPPLPGPPLRIAVLGDLEGPHTRRWLRVFVEREHDVHAISYYPPVRAIPGVALHVLSEGGTARKIGPGDEPSQAIPGRSDPLLEGKGIGTDDAPRLRAGARRSLAARLPADWMRLIHALRYKRAGLRRVLDEIRPDVFHAHYVVEHGFYGAFANWHPYAVSAWGSDLLIAPRRTIGRHIASYALGKADLVTVQDPSMTSRAVELGAPAEDVHVVRLGIDALFFDGIERSVNVREDDAPPAVISDRALEPLYNVDMILRALSRVRERLPDARLIVAHEGSEAPRLIALSRELGLTDAVSFVGRLAPEQLHEALLSAHVYVSVPRSDAFSLSTMEAMASGAFPVVSALPSVEGVIRHGDNGLLVRAGDVEALTEAMYRALGDRSLRRGGVQANRALAEAEGRLEANMLAMERHYYRLAGHPIGGSEAI